MTTIGSRALNEFDCCACASGTTDAEFSVSWATEDNVNPSNTQTLSDNQAVNFASGNGITQHAATFVSMDSDGHTLNYSVADGSVRRWFELAIG